MKQLIISPTCFPLRHNMEHVVDYKGIGFFKSTYPHKICEGGWIGKEDVILYYNDGISNFTIDIDKDVKIERTEGNVETYNTYQYKCGLSFNLDIENNRTYSLTITKLGNIEDRKTITYEVTGIFNTSSTLAAKLNEEIQKNNIFNVSIISDLDSTILTVNDVKSSDGNIVFKIKGKYIDSLDYGLLFPVLSKEYIKQLQSQCAAGKGFTDTANGAELYPSYMDLKNLEDYMSERPDQLTNVMYTLRFTNKRKSSKTKDEVVNQTIHIITTADNLKYMFGFESSPI